MRLRNHDFTQRINSDLRIEFARQDVTSYSGLELFRRYFRLIGLAGRIRRAFRRHRLSGDYSVVQVVLVFVALWLTGGNRLRHVGFIGDDPLVKRMCGLQRLPSDRSLSRWLKQFANDSLQALVTLNSEILIEKLRTLKLSRITLDFDGTVVSCGDQVGWAARGYNPFERFSKSYYPFLCHIAQTGHFFQVRNRPGNHHDSKGGALSVMRQSIDQIRSETGARNIEVRLDSAFFMRDILAYLKRSGAEFAIKVPMWRWLKIKQIINGCRYWHHASPHLAWAKRTLTIDAWNLEVDCILYRQKLSDKKTVGAHQLDLFSPDDGIYEYSVLVTNKTIDPARILDFYNGRCAMEHNIGELKGEFGFDCVPTNHYQANSAHQHLSVLAYNLTRNYQIDTHLAEKRGRTSRRTNLFSFESLKTIRFKLIAVAGRMLKRNVLRISAGLARENLYAKIERHLEAA